MMVRADCRRGMLFAVFAWALLGLWRPSFATLPEIGPKDCFAGFVQARNSSSVVTDDAIVISELGKNPGLVFSCRPFIASKANVFEVKYRATSTGTSGGQLYYAPLGRTYSDSFRWNTPALIGDGKWHVMRVGTDKCSNLSDWLNVGILEGFRWDPTDSPGGRLEVASVRFLLEQEESKGKNGCREREFANLDEDFWPDVPSEIWKSAEVAASVRDEDTVAVKSLGGTAEPRRAKAGSKIRLRYDFSGPRLKVNESFEAQLQLWSGECVRWEENVRIATEHVRALSDRVWRIEIDYVLPLCFDSCEMDVRLRSARIRCASGRLPDARLSYERVERIPGWEKPTSSSVRMIAGSPYFSVNGKVIPSLWGAVTRGGRKDGTFRHSSAPLDIVTVWGDTSKTWPRDGVFDPTDLDRRAEAHLRAHPDSYFIWSLCLYVPPDWARMHPADMAQNEAGEVNQDSSPRCRPNYSFASERAYGAMEETMAKMIAYLENSPYANRIMGYRIVSGRTIEWLAWTPMRSGTVLDFSEAARTGFERFVKRHYPEIKEYSIPTFAERQQLANGELLWDTQKHNKVIAYHDFYSTAIAEMAGRLCRKAKDIVGGKKVVGTYYGYTMTLNGGGAGHMRGHYALKHLLDSKSVDFILSPQEYGQHSRGPGSTCVDMKPFRTIQNHGIVAAVEDDTRTHNNPVVNYVQLPTEYLSIGVMRRNMGIALCRNQPFYTLALKSGCEFDFPVFARDADSLRTVAGHAIASETRRDAEIAVVVSEEAIKSKPMISTRDKYAKSRQMYNADGSVSRQSTLSSASLAGWPYSLSYPEYSRIGAPVDYVLAEDLADNPGAYKLYIFQCCTMNTPALQRAAEKLRERNCTILWTYAPGFSSRRGNSLANMKALTGVDFVKCDGASESLLWVWIQSIISCASACSFKR